MIENYQQERSLEPREPENATFATVYDIYGDGIKLQFDGMDGPSAKVYQCNRFGVFHVGDRVRVVKDSGTYVVEYPVGRPLYAIEVEAHRTQQVDNKAKGYTDLVFYYDTVGTLWFKGAIDSDSRWTKLTGTKGTPPRAIDP